MNTQIIRTFFVQCVSLTTLEEKGFEPSDAGEHERQIYGGELQKEAVLSLLTKRQRGVARCLNDRDLTRKETASVLGVSLQAIHQIVLRMRKRLRDKGEIEWKR